MEIMLSGDFDLCEKCNLETAIWFRGDFAVGVCWSLDRPSETYQVGGAEEYTALCLSCFEATVIGPKAREEWWQPESASMSESRT